MMNIKLSPPSYTDLEDITNYKFCSFDFAYENSNNYVKYVLDNAPVVGDRKRVLVDIKVHHLKQGEYPALKHWHCDCVNNPLDYRGKEERNHIFISSKHCLTEFLDENIKLNIEPGKPINFDKILGNTRGKKIQPCTFYSYGRQIHRATAALEDCTRLLVRVTETDIIKPRNTPFKVTYRK